ncbi:MAG: glycosyltransferase family 1 protein [Mycobacteriaceae bacterium]
MSSPLRVATVPHEHAYLEAALPAGIARPALSTERGADAGPWAPSPLLDPDELRRHAGEIDLVHVHFGFDHLSTDELRTWTGTLRELHLPLILTVHDLRNPHHAQRTQHDEHLTVLLGAAAEVVTLTPGAAAEIARRWGVRAQVIPHPAVLNAGSNTIAGTVGIHLKSLRRNIIEPERIVRAALAGAQQGGGHLRVDVHLEVLQSPALAGVLAIEDLDLHAHQRFTDAMLAEYLGALHVSVLAQRFGTHSGWLEACRDTGTAVVAPSSGYHAEQWSAVHTYAHDERRGLDVASLTRAVRSAVLTPPLEPADPAFRARQRQEVRAAHAAVYRRATGRQ